MDAEIRSSNLTTRREGQNLVMVAFDANVKKISHAAIVWAMEHVLKPGDILTIASVLSANRKLVEEGIQQKMEVWRSLPRLENRCTKEGVELVVLAKAAPRGELELAICREAVKLRACHVVLDKSLKNRRREFYRQNIPCDVTRMRRSGGVDVIRPSLRKFSTSETRSLTLWFPPPLLSYDGQIDEFEISLNSATPKSSPVAPPLPSPRYYYSGELKTRELRRLPSSATLATAHEYSSSISIQSTPSAHERQSSESSVNRPSFTSSYNNTDDLFSISHGSPRHAAIDTDLFRSTNPTSSGYESDDLFSIFHGSTRHTGIDTDLFRSSSSGYESDDLFNIGNASTRRTSPASPRRIPPRPELAASSP